MNESSLSPTIPFSVPLATSRFASTASSVTSDYCYTSYSGEASCELLYSVYLYLTFVT